MKPLRLKIVVKGSDALKETDKPIIKNGRLIMPMKVFLSPNVIISVGSTQSYKKTKRDRRTDTVA
jgi:hypothetical protein